jgi:hypothetical protein
MPVRLSPLGGAIVGIALCLSGTVTIYAAVWRPKWLDNFLLRPRWFNVSGPKAGRIGATLGASVTFVIGAMLVNAWAGLLPPGALALGLTVCFFGLLSVVGSRQ